MDLKKFKLSDSTLLVKPEGRIDVNTSVEFGQAVYDELDDVKELVLDFADVVYVSSMGLRVLLEFQKQITKQEGSMCLVNVTKEVMEIFQIAGFDKIITIQ